MQTMNSTQYDEIIGKIKFNLEAYEKNLKNDKYTLGLANGDFINITFPSNNIPHLLGVYTDKLRGVGVVTNRTPASTILKKLTNYEISYYDMKNKNFDVNNLFSEHILSKLEIFIDNLKVRTDDLYCIIKYNSNRTYTTGEEMEKCDYFIVRKHDRKYSALGLVETDIKSNYLPVTSRLFNNEQELDEFLNKVAVNQEITYATSYKATNFHMDYNKTFYTTLEDKLQLNKNLREIALKVNAIPSISRDFVATIERLLNNRQKSTNNSSILNLVKECILSNNIVEKEEVIQMLDGEEIPNDLDSFIDACNDLIYSKSSSNPTIESTYSSMEKDNKSLKEELELLKQQLLEANANIEKLQQENTSLKEENKINTKKLTLINEAFETIKNI